MMEGGTAIETVSRKWITTTVTVTNSIYSREAIGRPCSSELPPSSRKTE
jgi:hypothetical protein